MNLYFRELTHDWTGSPEHPKENRRYLRTWDDIACKVHEDSVFFQRNLYCRELTHGRTGSPEHPKENNRYMRTWDDIMHVKYTNVLYFSNESILEGTHARLDWFAKTSKRKYEISEHMRVILHVKVHEDSVFFKGIYTPGNSRTVRPVRPYFQKKITDICVHEIILCM